MEQYNVSESNGALSLSDLWRLFVSKWKVLLIVGILVAIVGGVFGVYIACTNVHYNAVISFNLSPSDSTDALLYNLQSEMFAEKLLLENNGLPPKDQCNEKDYNAALTAIGEFDAAREEKASLKKALDKYQTAIVENNYEVLVNAYNRIFDLLSVYKQAAVDSIADDAAHKAMIAEYEEKLKAAEKARDDYFAGEYSTVMNGKLELQTQYNLASIDVKEKRVAAEEAIEKVVAPWRSNNKEIREKIAIITKSATYEYAKLLVSETNKDDENSADVQNKGYIKITLSVADDEEFANWLVERYKSRVPDFVEKHMEEITGTTNVDCTLISPFSTAKQENDGIIANVVKFALIFAVVGVVLTYIICLIQNSVVGKNTKTKVLDVATDDDSNSSNKVNR